MCRVFAGFRVYGHRQCAAFWNLCYMDARVSWGLERSSVGLNLESFPLRDQAAQ